MLGKTVTIFDWIRASRAAKSSSETEHEQVEMREETGPGLEPVFANQMLPQCFFGWAGIAAVFMPGWKKEIAAAKIKTIQENGTCRLCGKDNDSKFAAA
jgi:hypothetical protein